MGFSYVRIKADSQMMCPEEYVSNCQLQNFFYQW